MVNSGRHRANFDTFSGPSHGAMVSSTTIFPPPLQLKAVLSVQRANCRLSQKVAQWQREKLKPPSVPGSVLK